MIQAPITDTELQSHLAAIEPDGMSIFVLAGGQFRGAFFHGTHFVNQMRANHNLGILETLVLGQACLCAALLIPTIKGRGRVQFRYDTNGPAAGFSTEADSSGYVRGYLLQDPIPVDKPLESWDLAPFFGPGTLTVTHFADNTCVPQTGTVEIKHRNIAKDLTWYFLQSEQIHTAFNTSIKFDRQGRVIGAGGMFLQAMPQAGGKNTQFTRYSGDELFDGVEHAFSSAPPFGEWFSEHGNRDDVIYGLFREFDVQTVLERDIVFDCPCSAERYVSAIAHLGRGEVEDILAHDPDPIEVVCHNCGSVYHIAKDDIRQKLAE